MSGKNIFLSILVTLGTSVVTTIGTVLVMRTSDTLFPTDAEMASRQKDDLLIELAVKLTGQHDEATVKLVKEQVSDYLCQKIQSVIATKSELNNVRALCEENLLCISRSLETQFSNRLREMRKCQEPTRRVAVFKEKLREVGPIRITSDECFSLMVEMLEIVEDDKKGEVPEISEALLQLALRLACNIQDDKKRSLEAMATSALKGLECAGKTRKAIAYKAVKYYIFEPAKFGKYVIECGNADAHFEDDLRQLNLFRSDFYASNMWPLRKMPSNL